MNLDTARTVALSGAALGQTLFVMLYLTFPWWKTFLGRALFGKAVALLLIIDFAAASRLFDFGNKDDVFFVLYLALGLGVWGQFFAFLAVKAENHDRSTGPFPETDAVIQSMPRRRFFGGRG